MTTSCSRCGLLHPEGTPCFALTLPEGRQARELQPGILLAGRYLLLKTVHHGGMSVVYLAEDTVQNRQVAIKELRLPDGTSDEETREAEAWFARESYLLSTLQHPLIPRFFSVFREQERSYLVQEFVPGQNLEQIVVHEGPVRQDLVVRWAQELCDLLEYLHTRYEPVIFRDLKPANMLIRDGDDALVVVDFGIARPYRAGQVGTVVGTPGYAPPEQYQGLATPQSDIYSLGATMHRLLTGHDPEHGTPFTFPPVRDLNPQVEPAVAAIVERALALNTADRFENAAAMNDALETSIAWPLSSRLRAGWTGSGRGNARASNAFGRRLWSSLAVAAVLAPLLLRAASGMELHGGPNFAPDRGFSMADNLFVCAPMGAIPVQSGTQLQPGANIALSGGTVWFTDQQGALLDYLTPGGDLGSCLLARSAPQWQDMVSGPDGTLWMLEAGGTAIDRISAQGSTSYSFVAGPGDGPPAHLAVSADGALWLTQPSSDSITRFDSITGVNQQFHVPAGDGSPMAIASSGSVVWFTETGNRIGQISAQGTVRSFALPGSTPRDVTAIAAAGDGSAWVTEAGANRVAHLSVDGAVREFAVPHAKAGLGAIAAAIDGSAWFVEQRGNSIANISSDGRIQEYGVPSANNDIAGLGIGSDGTVWFTETGSQRIGHIDPSGAVSDVPAIVNAGSVFSTGASTPNISAGVSDSSN